MAINFEKCINLMLVIFFARSESSISQTSEVVKPPPDAEALRMAADISSFSENDKIKVTKKGKIKTTKIGYFFDCQKIV